MFISKKKYDELIAERDNFEKIAFDTIQLNGRVIDSNARILEETKEVQELNHSLQKHNEELLARVEELEAEKEGLELRVDILNTDYDALDYEHVRVCRRLDTVCEERDHYEERCRYLEGEMEDKEELEAKLDFAIKQRDYYYDLLESTSEVEEKDE